MKVLRSRSNKALLYFVYFLIGLGFIALAYFIFQYGILYGKKDSNISFPQMPQQPELLKLKVGEKITLETNQGKKNFEKLYQGVFKVGEKNICILTENEKNPVLGVQQIDEDKFQKTPLVGACLENK